MVPSLPLVLKMPPIFSAALADCVEARLACRAESGVASTSPSPNSGVGMRKITLLAESAVGKVRLPKAAADGIGTSGDGVKVVHSAVERTVRSS